jgi:hypothetical protein
MAHERLRGVLALGIVIAGSLVMLASALWISELNNSTTYPQTLASLAALEAFVVGAVLVPLGFPGIFRATAGIPRLVAQVAGAVAGSGILAGGLYWETLTSTASTLSSLTLYCVTALIFSGLAVLGLSLGSLVGPAPPPPLPRTALATSAGSPSPGTSAGAPWAYCPFCAEPILAGRPLCWKCGRPVEAGPAAGIETGARR